MDSKSALSQTIQTEIQSALKNCDSDNKEKKNTDAKDVWNSIN